MTSSKGARYFLPIICTLLAISCTTTRMANVWKDTNYHGKASHVFVVANFDNPDMRHLVEETFSDELQIYGVNTFPSYRAIPAEDKLNAESIRSKIQGLGIDSVLLINVIGRNVPENVLSGEAGYAPGQDLNYSYSQGYSFGGTILSPHENDILLLETKLFDAKSEKAVWAARAKISMSGPRPNLVRSYVKKIVDKLASDGLIK